MRAYEDSLHRLGLDRIDILLAHDIGTFQHGVENKRHFRCLETGGYKAMDELRKNGNVQAIGLGVNENEICLDALGIGNWDVFLLAGRYTLLEKTPLDLLFPACQSTGTSIIYGGPFNSSILVGRDMWNYVSAPRHLVKKVNELSRVAKNYKIPLPAAAVQFPLFNPVITSVIPDPRTKIELNQILEWFQIKIPSEFWEELKAKNLLDQRAYIS